jgi:hypothetical protein
MLLTLRLLSLSLIIVFRENLGSLMDLFFQKNQSMALNTSHANGGVLIHAGRDKPLYFLYNYQNQTSTKFPTSFFTFQANLS